MVGKVFIVREKETFVTIPRVKTMAFVEHYSCECLGDSYSGRYCEITANEMMVRLLVSKSSAYIAIFAMVSVAMCIVIMDVFKYFFGIDSVGEEMKKMRKKNKRKKRKPVIQ
jgi:hypothetical protein